LVEAAAALRRKIHARADGQARPLGFVLTGGEVSDYKAVPTLLNLPVTPPKMMLADKGYDGDDVRSSLFDAQYLAGHPVQGEPQGANRLRTVKKAKQGSGSWSMKTDRELKNENHRSPRRAV
jgi:hypothetical protein